MLEQAVDLRAEGDELYALLQTLDENDWRRPTPFKRWTVNDVVSHLHEGDWLGVLSLGDPERFDAVRRARQAARAGGASPPDGPELGPAPQEGRALLEQWRAYFLEMCERLGAADPGARLQWFGPDMGVRMFTSARQMETWAHGQDVFDLLRRERTPTDRIKNIAVLGVRTFGWTFANRGLEVPEDVPYVRLTAPSGATWEWNEPKAHNRVEGSAVDFCYVVTQGRNIADVRLTVVGEPAARWMAVAQCFAGPPEDPPAPGARTWS